MTSGQSHRDFLTIPDFSKDELTGLFALADRMKRGVHARKPLVGKTVALLFTKSSTRTSASRSKSASHSSAATRFF